VRTYRFRDEWSVPGSQDAVQAVLVDLEHYVTWWPEVRAVAKLGADDAVVICRSRLPYSLELRLTAVHREPHLLEVRIDGDLSGHARWQLGPDPLGTRLVFDQQVQVRNRALALASYVARPLLIWNHHRMMRSCIDGLTRVVRDDLGVSDSP